MTKHSPSDYERWVDFCVRSAKNRLDQAQQSDQHRFQVADQLEPEHYRARHDPLTKNGIQLADVKGVVSYPHVIDGPVDVLFKSEEIDKGDRDAAAQFRNDFDIGRLQALKCINLDRVPGEAAHAELSWKAADARGRVWEAIHHLGGFGSSMSSAAWQVIGCGDSMSKFSEELGVNRQVAKGFVIAACEGLAAHYGYRS